MAEYRYLTVDVLSNTVIGELQLTGVSWGEALNNPGEFQGHLLLSDSRTINVIGTRDAGDQFTLDWTTEPARVALYVERDGVIVWGGIIWSRQYDSGSQTMVLTAREFESYFDHRRIVDTNVFATGTDQFTLVKTLVDAAAVAPSGDIGISTTSIGTCGQGIANVFAVYGFEKRNLMETIRELSKQDSPYGFDYTVSVSYDSNYNLTRSLELFYPRKGVSYSPSNQFVPVLEFPGSIMRYSWPEDGNSVTNRLFGFGPGSNDGQYISAQSTSVAGYPLLEDAVSYSNVPDPNVVDALTKAELNARNQPVTVLSATWCPTTDPVTGAWVSPNFGDFQIGDTFRIRITDARFPGTLETQLRLAKFDVAVGDNGTAEFVTGSFVIATY